MSEKIAQLGREVNNQAGKKEIEKLVREMEKLTREVGDCLEKAQNGADIPDKKAFVRNLGFIAQQIGSAVDKIISQKGVMDALNEKFDKTGGMYDTGRPIAVIFTGLKNTNYNNAYAVTVRVDGATIAHMAGLHLAGIDRSISFIVPSGSVYSCSASTHTTSGFDSWVELR
ncbi:hypothetical protein ID850_17900 [Xenorhabdus sp. Flor]|uniref:hypothetical protein n=1 Tax=Xenorhabdus cabanillasii TaxID=351673 RepID=UPI0019B0C650|nr:hypothetical protein [Xenorhabdus sp. Flor]MBD2816572.1 hypothetical protein [Xenorhabdus sp. Flor]